VAPNVVDIRVPFGNGDMSFDVRQAIHRVLEARPCPVLLDRRINTERLSSNSGARGRAVGRMWWKGRSTLRSGIDYRNRVRGQESKVGGAPQERGSAFFVCLRRQDLFTEQGPEPVANLCWLQSGREIRRSSS